ncbi:MAG TPA: methyltransferase domain-containing protein [Anaerolineae bacterium]|nr:methyltransferase domain-containing protein [Anaerolineae bacterium]
MDTMSVRDKYELELRPVSIRGKKLELYCVKINDPFVDKLLQHGEEDANSFPFWVKIWEASIILADHLIQIGIQKDQKILEIGAGMGVTGLFLSAFGYDVTITDYDEDTLELLRINAKQNNLSNVSVMKLDWNDPDIKGEYNIICGSELVYKDVDIEPVINLIQKYIRPKGVVFLSYELQRKSMIKLIEMLSSSFEIKNIVKTLRGEDELCKIALHTLTSK